ncbi:MAG: hypothetical protein ACRCZS_16275 [Chroococcidiopsis sp.]
MLPTEQLQPTQPNENGNDRDNLMRKLEQHYFRAIGAIDISHAISILTRHDGRIQITFPNSRR